MAVTIPFVKPQMLVYAKLHPIFSTLTAMITSFGFAIIVPSLRSYLDEDVKKLRLAILIGCTIPLICYIIWEAIIFSVIPPHGEFGLINLAHLPQPISGLMEAIANLTQVASIVMAAKFFTSICIVTAFLGVSLCLGDFLADGMQVKKEGRIGFLLNGLTFLPPLLLVIFVPRFFIFGISFAGVFCIILLILLPAMMALAGIKQGKQMQFFTLFNHPRVLHLMITLAIILLIWGVILNVQDFMNLF